MKIWIYRCNECSVTFPIEVEEEAEAPETAACPHCEDAEASRQFELPSGGCGCGGSCC